MYRVYKQKKKCITFIHFTPIQQFTMAALEKKRNIFSFGDDDDEDDDDRFISSVQPLPSNAVERSAFTATDFDPDTFLSSRRHLGLERMKAELNTHLKQLKTELVELINRDYQDFINLSTNLKGVDKDIEELKAPLADMEIQVKVGRQRRVYEVMHLLMLYLQQGVREHFQGVIDSLELQLQSRAQLRDKKVGRQPHSSQSTHAHTLTHSTL